MKDFLKRIKLNEGNISLALGIIVMVIAGAMLYNYFKAANEMATAEERISSTSTEVTPTPVAGENQNENKIVIAKIDPGSEYTIQKTDNLWKISERTYGTGYNWKQVYEANKATIGNNPGVISAGTKITLPKIETIAQSPEIAPAPAATIDHTVVKGDNLWKIATNICGSGFSYPAIAKENSISNPNLIVPNQVLKITCPARR